MDSPELERQFTVVSMALTMANKLVLAHKAELTNVRSNQRMAWTIVAVMAFVFLATAWWGMDHRSEASMANMKLDSATKSAKSFEDLANGLKAENTSVKSQLTLTEDSLRVTQGENKSLSDSLQAAQTQTKNMEADLKRARSDAEQAKLDRERTLREMAGLEAELLKLQTAQPAEAATDPE